MINLCLENGPSGAVVAFASSEAGTAEYIWLTMVSAQAFKANDGRWGRDEA